MKRLALLLALAAPVAAGDAPSRAKEVARLRDLAARFVAREKPGDAIRTLTEALSIAPDDADVHQDLLKLHLAFPDDLALWTHVLAARLTDAKGLYRRPSGFPREAWAALGPALEIARVRALAMERIAAQAKRAKEPEFARYLFDLGRAVTEGVPALQERYLPLLEKAVAQAQPDPAAVVAQLERAMLAALRAGQLDDAMRAAVLVRGIALQARRAKIELRRGEALETAAVQAMARIRAAQRKEEEPLRVADLVAIAPADRPAWEAAHADWTNPAVALSPNDRYRIESVCGVRTTAMATADVEAQHARLARWYGRDPFEKVPGTIRLCKSPAELEGEGQPYYWAGGFQSGNVTTFVVSASDRQGLATGLTHELTHRFDGAVYPMLPAWLMEGRAVYTAHGTLWPRSEAVEERVVSWGAIYQTSVRGYGGQKKLQELIEGTIEDYRDNYQAGYTLWLYLSRYRADRFGPRIEPYLKSFARKPGWDALKRFEYYFLDEKDGRPKDWKGFVEDWRKFVGEGAAIDAVAWKKEWQKIEREARQEANAAQARLRKAAGGAELASPNDRRILDRSNWGRIRGRSEDPALGERHAYAAGLWFQARGKNDDAADAFAWAREVDELTGARMLHVAAFHAKRGKPALAWLWRHAARDRTFDPLSLPPAPAAVLPLQRLVAPVLDGLAALERAYAADGRKRAARAMRADRVRLARAAGIDPGNVVDDAAPLGRDRIPPDCAPYYSLLPGLAEDYWAPAESWRNGNFFVDPTGMLVMGRRKPWDPTTGYKRDAFLRKVFVRGTEWFEGTYTVRVRVRLISAHLGASVLVGHTRHDRAFVVGLGGGDWAYATGRKEETAGFRSIHVSLNDLRSWDGGVNSLGTNVPFRTPRTSFLLTIHVSGPFVRVQVDGVDVLSHRTTTGLPIEGHVGFYLGSGLVVFEKPEARRHRVLGPWATCPCEHGDEPVDFARACGLPYDALAGRRLVGAPRDPLGSIFLVYTDDTWTDPVAAADAVGVWKKAIGDGPVAARLRVLHPEDAAAKPALPWGGALPADALMPHHGVPTIAKARADWLAAEAKRRAGKNKTEEQAREELAKDAPARPAWLSVDPHGVIRGRGVWIEPWWGGTFQELLRRLQGY